MRTLFDRSQRTARSQRMSRPPSFRPMLESLEERSLLDAGITGFTVTNLVSDLRGVAAHTDANLVNPWGFAETCPFRDLLIVRRPDRASDQRNF